MAVGIVDCGIGNIGSLLNAFTHLGTEAVLVSDPSRLSEFDGLVLPGVGAFDRAMENINALHLKEALQEHARSGRPMLAICLGMQLLCNRSEEGKLTGLEVVDADVKHLRTLGCRGKVPHVGFNSIGEVEGDSRFLARAINHDFYFVHSYGLVRPDVAPPGMSLAFADYEDTRFVAALQYKNIFATQFHPEKSGDVGLGLLSEFIACSKRG